MDPEKSRVITPATWRITRYLVSLSFFLFSQHLRTVLHLPCDSEDFRSADSRPAAGCDNVLDFSEAVPSIDCAVQLRPFQFSEGFGQAANLRRANFTCTCKRRENAGQTEQQVCPTESYLNSSGANSRRQRRQVKNS
jgi:hypothetical protein